MRGGVRRAIAAVVSGLVAVGGGMVAATSAEAAVPKSFTISGSGYGHGVGMSQYGAYELSRSGKASWNILGHYYSGATVAWKSTPRDLRVQVYGPDPYGSSSRGDKATTTTVTVTGGDWRLRGPEANTLAQGTGTETFSVTTTAGGRSKVTVDGTKYYGSALRIQWSGTRYYKPTGKKAVASIEGAQGTYRHGRLTATAREGVPNITNDVLLNTEYLYGIAEMPSSWGLAGGRSALAAQAITARSYAMAETYKSACWCHLVDDVRDQNYTGWKKENEGTDGRYGKVWASAVDATVRGAREARVLSVGGQAVQAPYFSSSGGRTADSEDVWTSAVSYLRSVPDPYSKSAPGNSMAAWTRTLTQTQARALFGLPDVASVKVTDRWASSGQARTLTATSSTGRTATLTGKADEIRAEVSARTTVPLPASWITSISAVS